MSNTTGFNYAIGFDVQSSGVAKIIAMMEKLESITGKVDLMVTKTTKTIDTMGSTCATVMTKVETASAKAADKLDTMGRKGSGAFRSMTGELNTWIARLGAGALAINALQTTATNEGNINAINFASGGEVKGAANIKFMQGIVNELGLPLQETTQGFKLLHGSMMGTGIEGTAVNRIFKGVATGTTAMGLSAADTNGVFLALSQIASKGTVSAEELRGQIGERLPGAFAIAARAMGVTTSKLGDMLKAGDLLSTDFLPKFAREIENTFSGALGKATNSAQANFNRLNNSIYELKIVVGQELLPTVLPFLKDYLIPSVKWIGEHAKLIGLAATMLGGYWVASTAVGGAMGLYTTIMAGATIGTGFFTTAVTMLNAVLWANPYTWIAGALVAIGAGAYYAWQNFEEFRGFLYGFWEVLKKSGAFFYDLFIKPIVLGFDALIGWLVDDDAGFSKKWERFTHSWSDILSGQGFDLAESFNNGWNKGIDNFKYKDVTSDVAKLTDNFKWHEKPLDKHKKLLGPLKDDAVSSAFANAGKTDDGKDKHEKLKKGVEAITGGGTRNTTINIHKLNESFTIHTANLQEGGKEVEEIFMRLFMQVVNSANQTQAN